MPGPVGRWGDETYLNQADVNRRITDLPRGRVYFAGDTYGQVPGWQEGFVDSARRGLASVLRGKPSTPIRAWIGPGPGHPLQSLGGPDGFG